MAELVNLWNLLQNVQLTDQNDQIRWRWTADWVYTVIRRSQHNNSGDHIIWKAKVEGKHRFFAWLCATPDPFLKRNHKRGTGCAIQRV